MSRVLAREFDTALEGTGLNVTQFAVLRAIQRHERESLTSVAEDLCMDRTSLYRAIGTMQRDGWASVVGGPDARARTAVVTTKGLRALERADPAWARTQSTIVDRFGRSRWAKLVAELQHLAECAQPVEDSIPAEKRER